MADGSTSDLRALYDGVLAPRLAALERERLVLRHAILAGGLLIGLPIAMAFCCGNDLLLPVVPEPVQPLVLPLSMVWLFAGAIVAITRYGLPGITAYLNYHARFKRDVVQEIFKLVSPSAVYDPYGYISAAVFDRSELFETQGALRGDDLVRGRIGETPFEACEIDRHYSTGGKNSRTVSVFHGLFFRLDFNKVIQGKTIVQPQRVQGIELRSRRELARVPLENPEFEKAFEVFSTNPVEARYILTPLLMERIVALHNTTGRPLCLSFIGNRAYVAIDYGRALFEPSIAETTSFVALTEMAEHFRLAELVVQELDLNTRIWTKEVDQHLLDEVPAANPLKAFSSGDLSVETVLKQTSAQLYTEENASGPEPEPPRRSRARVDHYSDRSVVRYRLASWALICMAFSLAFAVVAAAAASMMAAPQWTLAEVGTVAQVPPDAVEFLAGIAPVVLIAAAVVGGFITLFWITYTRRVVIGRDAIRVTRGLSPFARVYPRTEQTRILQLDNYLYLGKAGQFRIVNPSLSPMLRSKEEARWVAHEMRRALSMN